MTQDNKEQFIQAFRTAFSNGTLLKCTLSKPTSNAATVLKNVYLRPVSLKKGMHIAFNFRFLTRDEVKNHTLESGVSQLRELLDTAFLNADLFTADQDFSLQITAKGKSVFIEKKAAQKTVPTFVHDREKERLLQPSAPWLHILGITNAKGEVLSNAQDKWRQINKYLEIIQNLVKELPYSETLHVADMGSGKGYLTFALYDFLKNNLGLNAQVTGIEMRPNLVELCNKTAKESNFEGLYFVAQNISDYKPAKLDMLIALHACDTATDLALAAGIHNRAKIIVAAPCCHKQIRKEMDPENEMAPLLRHGILKERQAEMLTDGIRALLLDAAGYQTKVFEFISTEHTAKNVMITAVQPENLRSNIQAERRKNALEQIAALKAGFGIKQHFLEGLLTKISIQGDQAY